MMRKRISEKNDAEQLTAEDLATIHLLQSGWTELEKMNSQPTPQLLWFEQQIAEHKQIMKHMLIRDLSLFLIVALAILVVSLTAYVQLPLLYLGVQVLAILIIPLSIPLYIAREKRKRVSP